MACRQGQISRQQSSGSMSKNEEEEEEAIFVQHSCQVLTHRSSITLL
jgi:hypothetical protein